MAFSAIPTAFLGGSYAADNTAMTVPLSFFPEVSSAEADESTGDSRKIIYGLLKKWESVYAGLSDKPTRMKIQRSSTAVNSSGQYTVNFNISFTLSVSASDVAAES